MNIHQLSVRYLPEQDRILLSVNTTVGQEFDIWLTRRITLALWPQLNRMATDHFAVPAQAQSDGFVDLTTLDTGTRKVLADFRRQELLQTADFETPYRTGQGTRPLGETPLLATEITMTPVTPIPAKGQQADIHFKEHLGANSAHRGVQLALQPQLIFSLMKMLDQAMGHAQWVVANALSPDFSLDLTPGVPADDIPPTDPERPRYLN
jgi:hypothetical protein